MTPTGKAGRAGSTVGGLALLVPLVSAFSSSALPLPLRLALVALWLFAVVRPHHALVALAALAPFASWLPLVLDLPAGRYAEALVLATLSGAVIAARRPSRSRLEGQPPPLWPAAIVFAVAVTASAAVTLQLMPVGTHAPWASVRDFFVFLTREYFVGPPGSFTGVADAALLLEGVGLIFIVARHARDGVEWPGRMFAAITIAGTGTVLLTLVSPTSTHVPDFNVAGSSFAMAACLALAFALNERHTRRRQRPALPRACWIGATLLLCLGVIAALARGLDPQSSAARTFQIGGAPGLVAVAAFLWMLAAVALRLVRGLRADPRDRLLVGAFAGLSAFVLTWITSHSMLVREAAFPFWILMGAAVARADGNAQPPIAQLRHRAHSQPPVASLEQERQRVLQAAGPVGFVVSPARIFQVT